VCSIYFIKRPFGVNKGKEEIVEHRFECLTFGIWEGKKILTNYLNTTSFGLGELQGVLVTGLSYYVMTWSIKKKGSVFTAAFNPLLVVFSFLLQIFFLGNSAHLGRYVISNFISL